MTREQQLQIAFAMKTNAAVRALLEERNKLADAVAEMTSARDELGSIALDERWTSRAPEIREAQKKRIGELMKVGCRACDLQRDGKMIGCLRHG